MKARDLEAKGAVGLRIRQPGPRAVPLPASEVFGVRDVREHPHYGLHGRQGGFQCGVTDCVYVLLLFWSLSRSKGLAVC